MTQRLFSAAVAGKTPAPTDGDGVAAAVQQACTKRGEAGREIIEPYH